MKISTIRTWLASGLLFLAGGASAQSVSKTELITYHDNTSAWVLGQTASVTCAASVPASTACDGDVVSATAYHPTHAMPVATFAFGRPQVTLVYDTESLDTSGQRGTVSTVTDALGRVTRFSAWRRGIPGQITYADSTGQSAVVDENGWILSVTDENGFATSFEYDTMGGLALIRYPSGDTQVWADTTRSFKPVLSSEYGIAAGHWSERVQTGGAVKLTYFDAMWRPLLVREYDESNVAGTERFTRMAYDAGGRVEFTSYPSASSSPTTGVWTDYDALGRPVAVSQDSELGLLTTTTSYGADFSTTVTNPRQQATTTRFQTYDEPSTDAPVRIDSPEGVTTSIERDPFGKPTSIARSGMYNGSQLSATRRYVYDGYQQLCKTLNPESGATVMEYDAAGNLAWSASGQPFPSLVGCDRELVAADQMSVRSYDARNRVRQVTTPGNVADIATDYAPDGLVSRLTASNPGNAPVVTEYTYNRRRLLVGETSTQPGQYTFSLAYGYNANGHPSLLIYPDGEVLDYAPDAHGRPTRVGTYATAIRYFPNGAIRDFSYGNGVLHSMQQNERQLPSRSIDSVLADGGVSSVLDDSYSFDANGNVTDIVDGAQAGLTTRHMAYDGLDRLVSAESMQQWGSATYGYDPLDNLRIADQGSRKFRYQYGADNRLASITSPAGADLFQFGYDVRGNTTSKNAQSYVFDAANRMNQVTGKQAYRYDGQGRRVQTTDADGKTTFWIYGQGGQVLYTSEARRSQNLAYIYLGNTQVATRAIAWGTGIATVRYQHTDALGSPVAETDADRNVVKRNSYTPYGEAFGTTSIDGTGYTGHVMDRDTGLTYMQQRYYDPQVGRFLSVDPYAADSGAAFNRYVYANSSPYHYTDPDGRQSVVACGMPQNAATCAAAGIVGNGSSGAAAAGGTTSGAAGNGVVAGILAFFGIQMSEDHSDDGSSDTPAPTAVANPDGTVTGADGAPVKTSSGGERAGKRFRPEPPGVRADAQGKPCVYCGKPTTNETGKENSRQRDHGTAKSRGGDGSSSNENNSCASCNNRKNARDVWEWVKSTFGAKE
jgi:RHS repeat-associated protein